MTSSPPAVPQPSFSQPKSFWSRYARQILGVALLALAVHDVFGSHGFLAMRRTQKEIQELQSDIARLHRENGGLSNQVQSLKTDPKTIERIAREMGMAKPGETIFKLRPPNSPPPAKFLVATRLAFFEIFPMERCRVHYPAMSRARSSGDHSIRPVAALLLWAVLCLVAAFYASSGGYGGRPFAATLLAFSIFSAGELWLACSPLRETLTRVMGPQGGAILALWPLAAYAVYAIGTGSFAWWRLGIAAAYALLPVALAVAAQGVPAGAWQDYAAMLAIAAPFKLDWLHRLFPYPHYLLAYAFAVLFAVNIALATFVFVRHLDGIGYTIGWSLACGGFIALGFALVAAIDIPLGILIHFIRFAPHAVHWTSVPLVLLGILVFTAWPEEFLFRGLLQNALGKTLRNENLAWILASIVFGLSHIANGMFPNWRYVLLATLAGLCYGFTWRKTGSIFPSAILHALVDTTWHFLFRTL